VYTIGVTIGAFKMGFDTVNLHRPTQPAGSCSVSTIMQGLTLVHFSAHLMQSLRDTLGGVCISVTKKAAQVELQSGRV